MSRHPLLSTVKGAIISTFRERIAVKFAFFFSLLVLLATGTVGFLVYLGAEQSLRNASTDRLEHTGKIINVRLEAKHEAISKDLRFLVATPPVQGIVRAHVEGVRVEHEHNKRTYIDLETRIDDQEWRDQLANTLSVFLENRLSYVRASFIGLTPRGGHEIVRVEKRDGQAVRVPRERLQSRRQDAFFQRGVQLPQGGFQLSDITLTPMEEGAPATPVARAMTPVYASNGRVYGCVAIHVNMRPTFEAFDSLLDADFTLYLANGAGQMLVPPRTGTLAKRFPEVTARLGEKAGASEFLPLNRPDTPEEVAYFERVAFGTAPNQHHLVLGVTSPYETILGRVERVRTYSLLITLFFGVVGIGLVLVFSGYLTQPLRQVTRALSRFGRYSEARETVELPTHRRDEIGALARTFDAMTLKIQQQMHEVADQERRQRSILETSAEGIIVVTEEGLIETFNQAAGDLFDRDAEAIEGTSIGELFVTAGRVNAGDSSKWVPLWKQTGSGHEITGRRADGSTLPLSLAISAFTLSGEKKYALFLQNISERKRYEKVLQDAKEQAEEVARMKSAFLANMSHEIRTPLTTVTGYAGVLAEEASDEHREFAQFILKSGERLMGTLNAVLSMAQLEASGVEIEPDVLNVLDEAREITSLFKPLADEKGLTLEFQSPMSLEATPVARLDQGAFSSILQNLIGNAIKFTEEGSITVHVTCDADEVHLHVADTGVGIAADFLPHLFDKFVQESAGMGRSHEGSGLGLAISRRLVDLMNGRIAVESEKGRGTEFTVSFPRVEALPSGSEASLPCAEVSSAASDRSEVSRVLVVEDNVETATLMQELLGARLDLTAVSDGVSALRQTQEHTFDMVLLDINLGGQVSGVDVLRGLRAQPVYKDIPIAAITAYALPGDRESFLEMGFDAYLPKPFAPENLRALIRQLHVTAPGVTRPSRRAQQRRHSQGSDDMATPENRA